MSFFPYIPDHDDNIHLFVCACVRACVRACLCVCLLFAKSPKCMSFCFYGQRVQPNSLIDSREVKCVCMNDMNYNEIKDSL